MIGLKRGIVELVPYNPEWKILFKQEKETLQNILENEVLGIEHIGSTAIVDISAKPVIDIAVGISSMKDVERVKVKLENAGWIWRPKFGDIQTHIVFAKGNDEVRTHYLHLMKFGGIEWKERIAFRDYLNSHDKERKEYEDLKQKAMTEFGDDRLLYTKQKDEFVKRIVDSATI